VTHRPLETVTFLSDFIVITKNVQIIKCIERTNRQTDEGGEVADHDEFDLDMNDLYTIEVILSTRLRHSPRALSWIRQAPASASQIFVVSYVIKLTISTVNSMCNFISNNLKYKLLTMKNIR
jgi:hypothetical protein